MMRNNNICRNKDNEVIIFPNALRFIIFFLFTLLFSVASFLSALVGLLGKVWIITSPTEGFRNFMVFIIVVIGIGVFLPMSCFFGHRLLTRKPSLIINYNGLYDNASYTAAGFIKWEEIENVVIYKQEYKHLWTQMILGIKLKNTVEFFNRYKGIKKLLIQLGKYPVNIPQNTIGIDIGELYQIINKYRR